MLFELKHYLKSRQTVINDALIGILDHSRHTGRIRQAMEYSLMAGGKRLRPILCMAACESVGGRISRVMNAACALEMIHTYSLIHDDLPAMDDDALRRGKPSCHMQFDEATAMLAGDALLTLAFEVSANFSDDSPDLAVKRLRVIHSIAHAAGFQGMIEGQMRDIASEGVQLTLNALEDLHALKTGALIESSVYVGACLGEADSLQIERLGTYAKRIGLAFQVMDDILNIEGDPAIMGKAVGTDANRSKNTYPALLGLENSKAFSRRLIDEALMALNNFDNRADPLRAVARYVIERNQ
jgi:geranylgeranyl diphosphate synthase type II